MEPYWLMVLSWVALGLGFASAVVILVDEFLLGHRQQMWVMNLVHPISALYWGPIWLWAYIRNGRKNSHTAMRHEAERLVAEGADVEELEKKATSADPRDIRPWHIGNAVSHCGAGCTLGDIGGEWILATIFASPVLGILGTYGWEISADFVLAWTLGIAFQYFTIVPMRDDVGKLAGVWQAIKVDTLSIIAFQVGLFGWMALAHFVLFQPPLKIDTSGHWFMMQVGMIVGFFTAWPANRWLVRTATKEKMDRREHVAALVARIQDSEEGPRRANGRTGAESANQPQVPARS